MGIAKIVHLAAVGALAVMLSGCSTDTEPPGTAAATIAAATVEAPVDPPTPSPLPAAATTPQPAVIGDGSVTIRDGVDQVAAATCAGLGIDGLLIAATGPLDLWNAVPSDGGIMCEYVRAGQEITPGSMDSTSVVVDPAGAETFAFGQTQDGFESVDVGEESPGLWTESSDRKGLFALSGTTYLVVASHYSRTPSDIPARNVYEAVMEKLLAQY
ncbi:hypothetical protein ACX80Z_15795 [Arthrobacter sp. TMT4-20]